MQCDWCHLECSRTYRTDEEEWVCRTCWEDVLYCRAGGQIPQDPEDR